MQAGEARLTASHNSGLCHLFSYGVMISSDVKIDKVNAGSVP